MTFAQLVLILQFFRTTKNELNFHDRNILTKTIILLGKIVQKGPYAQEMANANFFVLKAIDVKI